MPKRALLVLAVLAASAGAAHAQAITATIDGTARGAPISPHLYGMFIEQAGSLLEQGIRAEMLVDRKFYFAVGQHAPSRGRGRFGGAPRNWQAVGPEDAVRMDSAHAYASDHAPSITVAGSEPRGIQQGGVAIKAGEDYTGRIVIAGDPGATVSVSLIWGAGAAKRRTVRLTPLTRGWATRHFRFPAPGASSDTAHFEVTGTGSGTFRIGAISLMPADNIQGFRRGVITALARLHSGVYRFPGGNFVSGPYDWRDAIGDPDRRPPRWDPVWSALQSNDFGLDEFMTFCKLVGVEPYITVNAGFGDAYSAAQEVQYANGAVTTPMGKLRAANGHPEPYHIRYWGIGNEMWGDWQFGYMKLDQWIWKQGQFAREMRQADPTIELVGSGAMPDAMTGSGMAKRLTGKVLAQPLGPADWSAQLLTRSPNDFEILSQHFYVYGNTHYDLAQGKQVPDDPNMSLVEWSRKPANMVRVASEEFQTYLDSIPAVRQRHITVAIDEWAYSGGGRGSFKVVPALAWALDEMTRHSAMFTMANFTFATSTLSSSRTDAVLNPVGLMFELYATHFGRTPLAVSGSSPQPAQTKPVGMETPHVNAGSPTYPLDVAAALSADGRTLTVAVVNPSEASHQLELDVRGLEVTGAGKVWQLAPGSIDAANLVGRPPQVRIEEAAAGNPAALTIPAISVAIYAFPLK